jgi:hypothetical protein
LLLIRMPRFARLPSCAASTSQLNRMTRKDQSVAVSLSAGSIA